ncbi:MAG: hypothetical protein ABIS26_02055, partial [Candidatus Paceibacterota bacterium]
LHKKRRRNCGKASREIRGKNKRDKALLNLIKLVIKKMYIPLILFFTSFFAIIFMVGRKLPKLEEGELLPENGEYDIPYIKEVGPGAVRHAKKYGHAGVVMGIRMYVKSSKSLRNTY